MADAQAQDTNDKISERFLRGAGHVRESDNPVLRYFPPARWAVLMIQYLIAVIIVTIAEGFKAIVSGGSKKPKVSVQ